MGEGAVRAGGRGRAGRRPAVDRLDIGWGVATVLRSRAFFAAANLGTRVVGPVEFVVGAVPGAGLLDPPPSTLVLADWAARLGQDLFNPPNVGGWPGGRTWLTLAALIGRANFAAALASKAAASAWPEPPDALGLADRDGRGPSLDRVVGSLAEQSPRRRPGARLARSDQEGSRGRLAISGIRIRAAGGRACPGVARSSARLTRRSSNERTFRCSRDAIS